MKKFWIVRFFRLLLSTLFILLCVTTDIWFPPTTADTIRRYSRPLEFDYIRWEITSIWDKLLEHAFGISYHLTVDQQRQIVKDYFRLLSRSFELEQQLTTLISDPDFEDEKTRLKLEKDLELLTVRLKHQSRLAEPVLQTQLSFTIAELAITNIHTPWPPLLYQSTPLPRQLIISPRDTIRQEKSISLHPDITLEEIIELEQQIEANTDYSALVVPIGGVGTYPSMIIETNSLSNLLETASHEWIHNHLIFRPLGLWYDASPALRTMNETTASIAGSEIMTTALETFYPGYFYTDLPVPGLLYARLSASPSTDAGFNFSETMYETRIQVDQLLEQNKINQAEAFMEEQRKIFWENGYLIRKLNQAYFSFYGAYADSPYSAAGRDPVGENVRIFRAQQPNLASFIRKMSWMRNYRQLRIAARSF